MYFPGRDFAQVFNVLDLWRKILIQITAYPLPRGPSFLGKVLTSFAQREMTNGLNKNFKTLGL